MPRLAGRRRWICLCAALAVAALRPCAAQELQPRRWTHLPMDANFLGVGYAYTEADISDAPAFRLEDVHAEVHTIAAKYTRTFELLGKSARIDVTQGYQSGHWEGLLDGEPASTSRDGWTDTLARFAVNVYGAPPLRGRDYAEYRASHDVETIVGVGLEVQLPTGEYMENRLINLGTNRFTFRPQIGVVHNRGSWSLELTGSAWLYTDNDDFLNGSTVALDPLLAIQGHLTYTFRPGLWISAAAAYGYGAQSTVNGVEKDDRKENLLWALTGSYPISRDWGVSVLYIGKRRQADHGEDTDTVSVSVSHFW